MCRAGLHALAYDDCGTWFAWNGCSIQRLRSAGRAACALIRITARRRVCRAQPASQRGMCCVGRSLHAPQLLARTISVEVPQHTHARKSIVNADAACRSVHTTRVGDEGRPDPRDRT